MYRQSTIAVIFRIMCQVQETCTQGVRQNAFSFFRILGVIIDDHYVVQLLYPGVTAIRVTEQYFLAEITGALRFCGFWSRYW